MLYLMCFPNPRDPITFLKNGNGIYIHTFLRRWLYTQIIIPRDIYMFIRMSHEKKPSCLGFIGDYTTQL